MRPAFGGFTQSPNASLVDPKVCGLFPALGNVAESWKRERLHCFNLTTTAGVIRFKMLLLGIGLYLGFMAVSVSACHTLG